MHLLLRSFSCVKLCGGHAKFFSGLGFLDDELCTTGARYVKDDSELEQPHCAAVA
jgi:hypothetical protein